MSVNVTFRGPIFDKKIDDVVRDAILKEGMDKFEQRVARPGKRLGRKNNPIGPGHLTTGDTMELEIRSTLIHPRTTGRTWISKNVAAVNKMSPFVLRKIAKRIVGELS